MKKKTPRITSSSPIGIFDSGIGGLTVARAIVQALPKERLVYFGDTAHLPYGDKSPQAIRKYSAAITDFLIARGCKAIVIACNTASAFAYDAVRRHAAGRAPVINVIDPVIRHVESGFAGKRVGIIGTKGTIESRVYERKLKAAGKAIRPVSFATRLLAPMIEEDYLSKPVRQQIVWSYLASEKLQHIDAMILGCTHYPIILKDINVYYGGKTRVIDSAKVAAKETERRLSEAGLLNTRPGKPVHRFYVSDYTASFERVARRFFGRPIHLVRSKLWEVSPSRPHLRR